MKLNLEILLDAWHTILMLMAVLTMLWRLADEARQQRDLSNRQLLSNRQ